MTREEQRAKAAHEYIQSDSVAAGNEVLAFGDFINGAKWADFHPHWIPVEDELPKETGWYLVATPTLNSKIDVAFWDGKWFRLITITHWMPMPVPPRKEE